MSEKKSVATEHQTSPTVPSMPAVHIPGEVGRQDAIEPRLDRLTAWTQHVQPKFEWMYEFNKRLHEDDPVSELRLIRSEIKTLQTELENDRRNAQRERQETAMELKNIAVNQSQILDKLTELTSVAMSDSTYRKVSLSRSLKAVLDKDDDEDSR